MEFIIVDRADVRRIYVSDITTLTSVVFSFSQYIDEAVKFPDFASVHSVMTRFIEVHDDMKLIVDETGQTIQVISALTDVVEFEAISIDQATIESIMAS